MSIQTHSIVALVGRPNVGKSTLFNRITRSRKALVDPTPGVTRDRHYEKVMWNDKLFMLVDTGGIELAWGNVDAVVEVVEQLGRNEGLGKLIAMGSKKASRIIGKGSEEYAIEVKGMEVPYHDPRAFVSMATNYATASRGACHMEAISYWLGYGVRFEGWYDPEEFDKHDSTGKGKLAADFQNYVGVYNALGLCQFIIKGKVGPQHTVDLVNAALEWDWSTGDLLETGERLFNLKRLINLRLGLARENEKLPALLKEAYPEGGSEGYVVPMEDMLTAYYQARRWDSQSGMPTAAKLNELGLGWVDNTSD